MRQSAAVVCSINARLTVARCEVRVYRSDSVWMWGARCEFRDGNRGGVSSQYHILAHTWPHRRADDRQESEWRMSALQAARQTDRHCAGVVVLRVRC